MITARQVWRSPVSARTCFISSAAWALVMLECLALLKADTSTTLVGYVSLVMAAIYFTRGAMKTMQPPSPERPRQFG